MTHIKGIRLGDTLTENNIFLAPMAGGSDIAFRKICRRFGAGMGFTELCTAKGIRYRKSLDRTYRYLEICEEEKPVAIQLFGNEPEDFTEAIPIIFDNDVLAGCAAIDINMGCPVKKVVKTGAGSALMGDIKRAEKIIKAAVLVAPVPVSVKFRKGTDPGSVNAVEFAKMCEQAGASMITVHGRTADQMYSGKADWEIIAQVKGSVGIPVIGNGDITGRDSADKMFVHTGVDGIMVGRAALGDPWVFAEILGNNTSEPDLEGIVRIMRGHLENSVAHMGERAAVKEMRKHFAWYIKGMKGVAGINGVRDRLLRSTSYTEASEILDELLSAGASDLAEESAVSTT